MIDALIKLFWDERNLLVKSLLREESENARLNLELRIGRQDALISLVEAWRDDKLSEMRMLTDKGLEAEIAHCERHLNPDSDYWRLKLSRLRLLQQLHQAWFHESLALVQFQVSIQE